jgi:molybdate transport system substrate-binding protein
MITRRSFGLTLAIALGAATAALPARAGDKPIVFAAASLKNALDAVNAAWKAETGKVAAMSYAASSALARQIEQGAPAELFISADLDWMKYLSEKNLIKTGTETHLLGNRLVLIAPGGSTAATSIAPGFPLAGLLGGGKLAMADVKAVPAGKYGKAALEFLDVWASVETSVAQAENVRAALKLVAIGEAALGIVYRTDAMAEPQVKVVGLFPEDSHPPIIYPMALTAASDNPDAAAFSAYLRSDAAKAIFEDQGFTAIAPKLTN